MSTKLEKINSFDPNGFSTNDNFLGLPFTLEESEIVIIPVPWEVTVSYQSGTANGPQAILEASAQVDLFDPYISDAWKMGINMMPISDHWRQKSDILREKAFFYINAITDGDNPSKPELAAIVKEIHQESISLKEWIKSEVLKFIDTKTVILLGGDHSTPLGFMEALSERHSSFGILQIDAHADLRDAYEGFEFSHASIMFNALKLNQVSKLVQVGIRDYCEAEAEIISKSNGRIITFFDRDIKHQQFEGKNWKQLCREIIDQLPDKVYLSFDIDGLDPKLCPNTGTPVAGGFETEQVLYLIQMLVESGKTIIGFDLNEVAPGDNEWNANVGARLLYRIANMTAKSQGRS